MIWVLAMATDPKVSLVPPAMAFRFPSASVKVCASFTPDAAKDAVVDRISARSYTVLSAYDWVAVVRAAIWGAETLANSRDLANFCVESEASTACPTYLDRPAVTAPKAPMPMPIPAPERRPPMRPPPPALPAFEVSFSMPPVSFLPRLLPDLPAASATEESLRVRIIRDFQPPASLASSERHFLANALDRLSPASSPTSWASLPMPLPASRREPERAPRRALLMLSPARAPDCSAGASSWVCSSRWIPFREG